MNDVIDKQTLEEMTRFTPSSGIRNIMVTGGNGFMYVSPIYTDTCYLSLPAREVPRVDKDATEVPGSFGPSPSPIKTTTTSSLSTSLTTGLP